MHWVSKRLDPCERSQCSRGEEADTYVRKEFCNSYLSLSFHTGVKPCLPNDTAAVLLLLIGTLCSSSPLLTVITAYSLKIAHFIIFRPIPWQGAERGNGTEKERYEWIRTLFSFFREFATFVPPCALHSQPKDKISSSCYCWLRWAGQ